MSISGDNFLISKHHLREITTNILASVVKAQSREPISKGTCPQINKIIEKMVDKIERDIREARKKRLKINSNAAKIEVYE
jgi:hypothetical protein